MTSAQMRRKRIIELSFLLILSPILIPVCAGLALLIKITAINDPVLYAQSRVGKNGKLYKMYKFRSMVPGDHLPATPLLTDGSFKITKTDNITRVGHFMRRLSLDELPQIINIIAGDMSLIGPRPELPAQFEKYNKETFYRLDVSPGVTGLAQVQGRNELGFIERHQLDIDYVKNYSLSLDLKIVWLTIKTVITGDGLYQEEREKPTSF